MIAPPALRRLPGSERVLLNSSGGRRARLTRALVGAADWRRGIVDSIAFGRVAVAGTAGLPIAARWPWPDVAPGDLERALRTDFPAVEILGAVVPRQTGRTRLSLLCHAAGNPLVVKLGADREPLHAEYRALGLLTTDPLPGIATPRPFGFGALHLGPDSDPIVFLATSALGLHAQRPAVDAPLRSFEADLEVRLASLPRPDGTRADAVPVHGDLTPWNLRRTGRGLALFDWETVGWGAPASDLEQYRRTCDEVRPAWRRAWGAER